MNIQLIILKKKVLFKCGFVHMNVVPSEARRFWIFQSWSSHMVVSYLTWVLGLKLRFLFKNNKCLELLSHLNSPNTKFFQSRPLCCNFQHCHGGAEVCKQLNVAMF